MFFLIGITISSFLAVLLLLKRQKSNADRILMIWMAAMAIHQILFYLSFSGHAEEFPHLMGLVFPWPALHGGFLFIYVTTMTRQKPLTWLQMAPHFIPFWLLFVLAIPYYVLPAE
ncbi:MAG TPA: hypothetical protein VJ508_01025, partial [Saprospiraceae bacterium]|nr:hypothetical protein [Saprospiraceae bacterium]